MFKIKVLLLAQIGVGFDCMGLAVSMYSEFYFETSDQPLESTFVTLPIKIIVT